MKSRYSIVIPVLHEVQGINDLLERLVSLDGSDVCEIILVDGAPDGDTIKAVTCPGVRCLQSPQGRANQMNAGAALAVADILIFLHADTRLPPQAFSLIDEVMNRGDFVGGAFDLSIDSNRSIYRFISRAASLRSRLTRIPYGDQAIFVRKGYFNTIGRYPGIPLMEDVAFMRKIKKAGGKIGFISTPIVTSARRWEQEGILYATLRNWLLLSAYFLGVSPDKLPRYYPSGKDLSAHSSK